MQQRLRISLPLAFACIVFSGAFVEQILLGSLIGSSASGRAQAINSLLYSPVYLLGLYLLYRSKSIRWLAAPANLPFLLFGGLAVISPFWALTLQGSVIDGLQLALTLCASFGFAATLSVDRVFKTLSWVLIFILGMSLFYVIFIPSLGLMSGFEFSNLHGVPQGVFSHKNRYAEVSSIGGFVALASRGQRSLSERALLLALSLVGLILADSAAKSASFFGAAGLWLIWLRFNRSPAQRVVWLFFAAISIIACLILLPVMLEKVTDLLGKDLTLSGRTLIWQHALALVEQRPIWGYGAASIWGSPLGIVDTFANYRPPHSHNLYIEMTLKYGLVGVVLMLACLLSIFRELINTPHNKSVGALLFLLFIAHLIRSPFEVVLFRDNQIGFLLLMLIFGLSHRREPHAHRHNEKSRS